MNNKLLYQWFQQAAFQEQLQFLAVGAFSIRKQWVAQQLMYQPLIAGIPVGPLLSSEYQAWWMAVESKKLIAVAFQETLAKKRKATKENK